jgi:hypothetical protein
LFDLGQRGAYGAERKEQVGIHVAAGGTVTPVCIRGISSLEKVLARDTHGARHLSAWEACGSGVITLAIQGFRAARHLPSWGTPIFISG